MSSETLLPAGRRPESASAATAWIADIHLFVEVGRQRSFSRAAEHLGMPHSTLSRRIMRLEERLGLRLFVRSTRQVEFTSDGLAYYARAEKVVADAAAIHEELAFSRGRPAGTLRVTLPECIMLQLATPWIAEFSRDHPEVAVQIDTAPEQADLLRDDFDVCITYATVTQGSYIRRTIASLTRRLYASPAYLQRRGRPTSPEDLAQHDCICMADSRAAAGRWTLRRNEAQVTVSVNGPVTTLSQVLAPELAREGLGIATGMPGPLQPHVTAGALVPVLPEWTADPLIVAVVLPDRMVPARVRAFIEFFDRRYREFAAINAVWENTLPITA